MQKLFNFMIKFHILFAELVIVDLMINKNFLFNKNQFYLNPEFNIIIMKNYFNFGKVFSKHK